MAGVAALAGGVYWLVSGSKEEKPQTKKQPKLQQRQSPASAASPSPTPSSTPSGGIMSGLINLLGALATPKSDTYYSSGKVARNAAPENPCISNLNLLLADIHVRHIQLKDDDFQLHYNVFDNVFQHLHKKMMEVDPYYRKYHSTPDEFDMDIVIRLPLNISESSNRDESDIIIEPNTAGFVQLKMGFVTIYRENPCLWDITSEHYKNKAMR
ncbi:ADP-ribosylation factor-like protein [Operophtera brumata]|uniref:ADP-ribosylation factor-like protein n=1 Tax=Operophtera brumata TaxID=104452 RepID=A0A0L7LM51_OPEBR|nr:ADP-ribosylation factor-like protein [Operophtera brumata]